MSRGTSHIILFSARERGSHILGRKIPCVIYLTNVIFSGGGRSGAYSRANKSVCQCILLFILFEGIDRIASPYHSLFFGPGGVGVRIFIRINPCVNVLYPFVLFKSIDIAIGQGAVALARATNSVCQCIILFILPIQYFLAGVGEGRIFERE